MTYKVFLSHSTGDFSLVTALANILYKFGINVFVAEWYVTPGERLDRKAFAELDSSDCVVVLLTKNGIRSNWVQQEVGYALKSYKPVIPLVEKGIAPTELAALQGREYVEYDPYQPQQALIKMSTYASTLKLKKEEQENTLLLVGGIIVLLLLLFRRKEMNTISYFSAEDKLRLKLCPIKGKKTKKIGRFKLWWDDEGNICALDIGQFTKELEEFRNKVTTIRLERIWKGVKVTDEDIKEARQELLKQLEEKW